MPYDAVLDQHIEYGTEEARNRVRWVFENGAVPLDRHDEEFTAFDVQPFHNSRAWARTTTSRTINETINGERPSNAVGHGFIAANWYLDFWQKAIRRSDDLPMQDDFVEWVDDLRERAAFPEEHGEPPAEVRQLHRLITESPEAVHTPYIRLNNHGDLVVSPEGIKRAAAVHYDHEPYQTQYPRWIPVYVIAEDRGQPEEDALAAIFDSMREGNQ